MSASISGRGQKVLSRFPRHMEAESRGKLIANVVDNIVRDQDVQAADIQQVRLAHRVLEARQVSDLLLLAGLHGIRKSDMAILYARMQKASDIVLELKVNIEADDDPVLREELAESYLEMFALATNALPEALHTANTSLLWFSTIALGAESTFDPSDLDTLDAIDKLIPHASAALRSKVLLEGIRHRILQTNKIHIQGNGTIRALLLGAATVLDLDLGEIEHSEDRYWHAAKVHDRIRLAHTAVTDSTQEIPVKTEYMGIEENPRVVTQRGFTVRKHAELFDYLRKGFDDAVLEIIIKGNANRTISPMFVNRDLGHGVGFFGAVPDGQHLVFTQGGRVVLDGRDVTSHCYAWQGACFAQYSATEIGGNTNMQVDRNDFVFADATQVLDDDTKIAKFATVTPAGTLDRDALLPHAGSSLPMPTIGIGKTRFAFFIQEAHFNAEIAGTDSPASSVYNNTLFASTPAVVREHIELASPRFGAGFVNASVFAADKMSSDVKPAAQVQLRWLERQAYKVKLLIPNRFRLFDSKNGEQIKDLVKQGIQRFRPAGVDVVVDYVEPYWVMGDAALPTDTENTNAIDQVRSQPVLEPISEEL